MAKKKKEVKEEKKKEKVFTIPLGSKHSMIRSKRSKSAVSAVKSFLTKNLKKDVKISKDLNEFLWSRGIQKPPTTVRVKVTDEDDILTATIIK